MEMDFSSMISTMKTLIKLPLQILHALDFLEVFNWTGIEF